MSPTDEIALEYLEEASQLDPVTAFARGDLRFAGALTDYSPAGEAARAELARRAVSRVLERPPADLPWTIGREAMLHRLQIAVDLFDAGDWLRSVSVFGPQVQIRGSFDLMPRDDDADWALIAQKLARVPAAITGLQDCLRQGIEHRTVAARRQAIACAAQTRAWAGSDARPGFFSRLAGDYRGDDHGLKALLLGGAKVASAAYGDFTAFLEQDYAPHARLEDGVGPDLYQLAVRQYLGVEIDLKEAYEFGWEELARIEREMEQIAEVIAPGQGVAGAVAVLEQDPARAIEGEANFRSWNQELLDRTVAELDGAHFDIPRPVRRVEAMIAPPGGSPAMYYTPPSLDFKRPGRTWYPTLGRTRFPLWNEVSTAYHEGLPGHHLQLAHTCYLTPNLHPFQTMLGGVSGHIEGWALYAERLMGELGYLENPDYRLGLLASQAMRAARVVVDIGLHLGRELPPGQSFHPGDRWSWALAVDFMAMKSRRGRAFCEGEVDRYLGVPAQAISYKIGERVWLEARELVRRNCGSSFDQKEFHRHALDLGCVGLAQLRSEMARLKPQDMDAPGSVRRGSEVGN